MVRWLELTADYRCNNRCVGCYSARDDGPSMSRRELADALRGARAAGATSLWLGGGEPTLQRDLLTTIRAARALGFTRIKLQTNGMLLAYAELTQRLVEAGITEVNFSIKGATAEVHDRYTQTPGSFELLTRALDRVREHGLRMEGDILVYDSSVTGIAEIVNAFAERGIGHFNLWLLSSAGGDGNVRAEVPRMSDVARQIERVMSSPGAPSITSLHTPACVIPKAHHGCLFHAADLDMVVMNPGGHGFRLETSPIEGGHFTERCAACSFRTRCNGLRADYLAIHGDAEFQPVA